MEVPDDRDDTVGMQGFGLFNIRERLSSIGGHMRIESTPGKDAVTLGVPLMASRGVTPGNHGDGDDTKQACDAAANDPRAPGG